MSSEGRPRGPRARDGAGDDEGSSKSATLRDAAHGGVPGGAAGAASGATTDGAGSTGAGGAGQADSPLGMPRVATLLSNLEAMQDVMADHSSCTKRFLFTTAACAPGASLGAARTSFAARASRHREHARGAAQRRRSTRTHATTQRARAHSLATRRRSDGLHACAGCSRARLRACCSVPAGGGPGLLRRDERQPSCRRAHVSRRPSPDPRAPAAAARHPLLLTQRARAPRLRAGRWRRT